jgi:hypothetical protein
VAQERHELALVDRAVVHVDDAEHNHGERVARRRGGGGLRGGRRGARVAATVPPRQRQHRIRAPDDHAHPATHTTTDSAAARDERRGERVADRAGKDVGLGRLLRRKLLKRHGRVLAALRRAELDQRKAEDVGEHGARARKHGRGRGRKLLQRLGHGRVRDGRAARARKEHEAHNLGHFALLLVGRELRKVLLRPCLLRRGAGLSPGRVAVAIVGGRVVLGLAGGRESHIHTHEF